MHSLGAWGIDHNVTLIDSAAWSEETSLEFHITGGPGGYVESAQRAFAPSHGEMVKATTIEVQVVGSSDVTFIKMDIEGSELDALKGAENTLLRCKPRVVASIYHNPEDILEIPGYLMTLVPDYTFYIRHHTWSSCDTTIYAIPPHIPTHR